MKPIPIAQYLSRQGKTVALSVPTPSTSVRRELAARVKPAVVTPTQEELSEAAYRKGRQDEREHVQRELGAALLEQRKALEEEFSAKAEQTLTVGAARMAEAIVQGLGSVEKDVADAVGAILRPFIDSSLAERALNELKMQITALFSSDARPMIRIRGPEPLLCKLRQGLASVAVEYEIADSDELDVVMASDATFVATRLSAWKEHLDSLGIGAGNG